MGRPRGRPRKNPPRELKGKRLKGRYDGIATEACRSCRGAGWVKSDSDRAAPPSPKPRRSRRHRVATRCANKDCAKSRFDVDDVDEAAQTSEPSFILALQDAPAQGPAQSAGQSTGPAAKEMAPAVGQDYDMHASEDQPHVQ
jgi:hypothetical protein